MLMELFLKLVNTFPKPKTAKIIKHLLNQGARIEGDVSWQLDWCSRLIDWCKTENRVFLRQTIELRLINLYWQKVRKFFPQVSQFIRKCTLQLSKFSILY